MARISQSEIVDIECEIVDDNPSRKAIAITDGTEETVDGRKRQKWFWIPRQYAEVDKDPKGHRAVVTVPRWLAEEKGLV